MPWATPTLKDVRKLTRDYVLTQLGAKAMIPNSVLRIMSDAMSGLTHLVLLYIDWLSKQLLPDTAETEWLDRHGNIWLVNADGSTGRKTSTFASGNALFTGTLGAIIPAGTIITSMSTVQYQITQEGVMGETGIVLPLVALVAGTVGNMPDGEAFGISSAQLAGVDSAIASGAISGGTDTETDEQLRERILRRIQQPPMGGDVADYEAWALAVPGVTRAWAGSEMGIGTVTVRFMMDDLRADNDGFPLPEDIAAVEAYLSIKRPVAVKDLFVVSPIRSPIDFNIANLVNDTTTVRAEIEASIKTMLFDNAAPGQTIFAAWKSASIMDTVGVVSFELVNTADDVMASPGHMAVLGDIHYE